MSVVTVAPSVMRAVSRNARMALLRAMARVEDLSDDLTFLATPPPLRRLDVVLEEANGVLVSLQELMAMPAELATAMVALDERFREVADRRWAGSLDHGWPKRAAARLRRLLAMMLAAEHPSTVAKHWDRLTPTERSRLVWLGGAPLGNVEGLPLQVRDAIHRRTLDVAAARLARTAPSPPGFLDLPGNDVIGAAARAEHLGQVDRLEVIRSADRILVLDLQGDGRAVLAVGDPSTADHVATIVPGIGTTLDDVPRLLSDASTLRREAASLSGADVATIAWLGYDTPPGVAQAMSGLVRNDVRPAVIAASTIVANQARHALVRHTAMLRTVNAGAHQTVVAHSYGSVVALRTMLEDSEERLGVDDVVVLGSPGAGTGVDRDALAWPKAIGLWSALSPTDPIRLLPVLGPDAESLGAVPLPLGPGNMGHVRYLAAGTVGLAGVAQVVVGNRGCPVPDPRRSVGSAGNVDRPTTAVTSRQGQ